MRGDVAGDRDVVFQRLGLPAYDVGPALQKPLIVGEPARPRRALSVRRLDGALAVWNRVGRIGDVGVERLGAFGRRVERESVLRVKIQALRSHSGLHWP